MRTKIFKAILIVAILAIDYYYILGKYIIPFLDQTVLQILLAVHLGLISTVLIKKQWIKLSIDIVCVVICFAVFKRILGDITQDVLFTMLTYMWFPFAIGFMALFSNNIIKGE